MRKVFYNGTIYTGEKKLYADYVIIEDNFIVEVGDGFDEERYCKEGAELIDLKGRMLLPGFIDAHAHPFTSAFQMSQMV
ncbi:amidohydrolase family protein, partial [Pseudomonas aeruginosa]|nr:amidohydrolase family protein [Pseudomonas aeruginosa]